MHDDHIPPFSFTFSPVQLFKCHVNFFEFVPRDSRVFAGSGSIHGTVIGVSFSILVVINLN